MEVADRVRKPADVPWYADTETYLEIILFVIILGVIYIYISGAMKGWQGVWVLINVIGGYIILHNFGMRDRIRKIWRGVLIPSVWGIALLNILLIVISVLLMSFLLSGDMSAGDSSGSGGNPFVSNILLVVVMFPIIPLFADAETYLFQAFILKLFLKDEFITCPSCEKVVPPGVPCSYCNTDLDGERMGGVSAWTGIILSALIFAAAHMLLLMSFTPFILVIGGVLLGLSYIKKGHLFAARVHLVYDLVLITVIFIFMLSDLGGMI